ncbi:MAG: hypothetical protein Q9170_001998 [Blastenia crenularia]
MPPTTRKTQGVQHAMLFFKTGNEWTPLGATYDRGKGQDTVSHIVMDGGIEICQQGDPESIDSGVMWKIRFEPGQYNAVHVDEFTRPGMNNLKHIAIQFRPLTPPTGTDTKLPVGQHKKKGDSQSGEPSTAPTQRLELEAPKPSRFPLARLSQSFIEDGYTELLLVFSRNSKKTKAFLNGLSAWTTPNTKAETTELEQLSLADYAERLSSHVIPYTLRPANRGFWLTARPETNPAFLDVDELPPSAIDARLGEEDARKAIHKRNLEHLEEDVEEMEALQYQLPEAISAKRQKIAELKQEEQNLEVPQQEGNETADLSEAKVGDRDIAESVAAVSDDDEDGGVPT